MKDKTKYSTLEITRNLGKKTEDTHGFNILNASPSQNNKGEEFKAELQNKRIRELLRSKRRDGRENTGFNPLNGALRNNFKN